MKFPIRINQKGWSKVFTLFLPSMKDPRIVLQENLPRKDFSEAISLLKFGKVFKITKSNRHPLTNQYLSHVLKDSVVLDLGASDGTTSLDLMEKSNFSFQKYYVTDLNIEIGYYETNDSCYFFDSASNCILIANNHWVVYPGDKNSVGIFRYISQKLYQKVNVLPKGYKKLINTELQQLVKKQHNIVIKKFDIFGKWQEEKADIVIAANILNRCYFTDKQLEEALFNICTFLKNTGKFVIVHDLNGENANVFAVDNKKVTMEKEIGDGVEIKNLVFETFKRYFESDV